MVNIDVMTYCSGYKSFIFERFIGSLYDTGFSGKVYIIGKETDIKTVEELKKIYSNIHFFIDKFSLPVTVEMRRFLMYEYLLSIINKPDYLLICDARDVLFQKNIEKYEYKYNLYFAEEQIKFTQDPVHNVKWLLKLEKKLSEKFYDEIKDNYVLCAGTTIGNFKSIYKYVQLMCNIIKQKNWGTFNADQAIHNYLYYGNKLDIEKIKILNNKETLINTVEKSSCIIKNGEICDNANNEVSYIVHQWDRLNKRARTQLSTKYNFIEIR